MIKKKDKDRNAFECIEMDEIKKIHEKEFEDNSENYKLSFNDLSQYSPSPVSKQSLLDENKIIDNKLFESMSNANDNLKNDEINWFDDNEIDDEKYNILSTEEKLSNLLIGENSPTLWCSNNANVVYKNISNCINNSNDKNLLNESNSNYKHILNNNDNINDNNIINENNSGDNNIIDENNSSDNNIINENNSSDNNIINENNLSDNNIINENNSSDNNIINENNSSDNNIINENNSSDNNIINENNSSDNNIINENNSGDNNKINVNNPNDNNKININILNDDNIVNKNVFSDNDIIIKNKLIYNNSLNVDNIKGENHNDDNENLKNKEKDYDEKKIHNEEKEKENESEEEKKKKTEMKENKFNNKIDVYFDKNYDTKKKVFNKSKLSQENFYILPNDQSTSCKNNNSLTKSLSEINDKNTEKLYNESKLNYYFDYKREKENLNKIMKEKKIYSNSKDEENLSFEKRETPLKKGCGESKCSNTNLEQLEENEMQEEEKLYKNMKELKTYPNLTNMGINYKNESSSKNEIHKNYNELNNSNNYYPKKKDSSNSISHDNKKTKLSSEEFYFNNKMKRDYSSSDKEVHNETTISNMKNIISKIEESVEKKKIKKQLIDDYENIFNREEKSLSESKNEEEEEEHASAPMNNFITLSSKMNHIEKHKLKRPILYNSFKKYNTYNYVYKHISSLSNNNNLEFFLKKKVYSSNNLYNIKIPIRKCLRTFKNFNRMIVKNKKYFLSEKKSREKNSFDMYNKDCYIDNSSKEIYEKEEKNTHKTNKNISNKVNADILFEMNKESFNQINRKKIYRNYKHASGEYEFNDKSENFYDNLDVMSNNKEKFYHRTSDISKTKVKELEKNSIFDSRDRIRDYLISKRNFTKENNSISNNNNINNNNIDNDLLNSINEDKTYDFSKYKQMHMNKNDIKGISECMIGKKEKDTSRILNCEQENNEMKKDKNEEERKEEKETEEKKEIIIKDADYNKGNEEFTNKEQTGVTFKREKSSNEIGTVKNEETEKNKNNSIKEKENNNENEEKNKEGDATPLVNKVKRRIIDCKNDKLKWGTTQVIIDIDDTIRSSGGYKFFNYALGGVDAQYQRGETYPGSFQFIFELAMNKLSAESKPLLLSVLTARIPQVPITEDSYLNKKFNEVAERRGIKNWGIDCENKTLYSTLKEWVWNETRGEKKFFNFKQLHKYVIQQNSVVRYIWIGDTGDMDKQAGEMMIKTFPQRIRAVFLHHVKGKDDNTLLPSDYFIKSVPVFFFRTYIGAATKAHAYNLIDKKGLTRVLVQAVLDLEKSKVPADSSKWEDLIKDIILSNAVDELDKYNAETVNRTKKIIAQKMKEISERKLQFIS
ncbi:conserved Plasmodium protein, unknown function [Plasmodium relictum]|uniref:Uncharacterized protein n=1 Tax=Plasmodium relictum TaxID=85471 RepID=A0A1J1HAG4_PLARL|nr:conserved Plasmodium protein, unknown function [Plasmodium relictum]CRH00591.1 conserved Plasmodium protein, unknown function [Plasmodium relictum]